MADDPEKALGLNPNKFFVSRGHFQPDGFGGQVYVPAAKHVKCDYFVLDLVHDKFSKQALMAYADACGEEYPKLAVDIRARIDKMP